MSENVGASNSYNPKVLHGLYKDNFTFTFTLYVNRDVVVGTPVLYLGGSVFISRFMAPRSEQVFSWNSSFPSG
jgi:hypothetical protein